MASGINLFVAPLHKSIDDAFLRSEFSKYGQLFSASVAKDEFGASRGYGFVHFCSEADGLLAKEKMSGKILFNTSINVELANTQKDRKYYNDGGKTSIWANEWGRDSTAFTEESETVCDTLSQISDTGTDDTGVSDVKDRMRKLFEAQCYTDVTFYPKNSRKQSISAHRAILAVGSPLFTKMLFGGENRSSAGMKMEVQISNLSFDAFTNIVKFMYTDEIFFENEPLVRDILEGAKQFGISSLVSRCKQYFENMELTEENVCMKLQMSVSNKIECLKERCIEFIQKNTTKVINSNNFEACNQATVRTICKLQSLSLKSEMELLEAVMRWLNAQPSYERKKLMEPLLKCIRFLTFNVKELGDALKKYTDLMVSNDGLSIMLYLYNPANPPNFSSLPSWCNKNTTSRCFSKENLRASPTGLVDPSGELVGKVIFPLKSEPGQSGSITELTSLLQMKCISGFHELKAIRLRFGKPFSNLCTIGSLTINIHIHPCNFKHFVNVQIVNSESVRVDLKKLIKVRRGDLIDIEAEAKNIKLYKFLQFDETGRMPVNPHFNSCISSRPKYGKLYFISEVEYGQQDRSENFIQRRRIRRPPKMRQDNFPFGC